MKPGETVGECIRLAREARGLTQEDVCRETRLSTSVLRAIEEDRFSDLPAGLYTRNFVRTLAEFFELDFAALWARLQEGRQIETPRGDDGRDPTVWAEETVPETRVRGWRPGRFFWLAAVVLALAAGGLTGWKLGWFAGLFDGRDGAPELVAEEAPTEDAPAGLDEAEAERIVEETPVTRDEIQREVAEELDRRRREEERRETPPPLAGEQLPMYLPGAAPPERTRDEALLVLEVEAAGVCVLQINVDDRRHLARHFDDGGGVWRIEGREFFIVSAEGSANFKLRFNGRDYPLPESGDGRLMAFRLDTRGAQPGN